jgi:hypothetical protein
MSQDSDKTNPIGYEDGGLIRGSFKANIGGHSFLIKEGSIDHPHREEKEYGRQGQPDSASYVKDFSTMEVTVMARRGMPDPETKRMIPFAFKDDVWILAATKFAFSTAGLQVHTGVIRRLYNAPTDPVYADE